MRHGLDGIGPKVPWSAHADALRPAPRLGLSRRCPGDGDGRAQRPLRGLHLRGHRMGAADRLADRATPVPAAHRRRGPHAVPQPRGPADRPGPDLRRGETGGHRDRRGSCGRARRGDPRPLAGRSGLAAPAAGAGCADLLGLHRRADAGRGGAARRRGGHLPLGGSRPDQSSAIPRCVCAPSGCWCRPASSIGW